MQEKGLLYNNTDKISNQFFPVFISLDKIRILIIGGEKSGLEKLELVLHHFPGAKISLVAMNITEAIWELEKKYPALAVHEKKYEPDDLLEANLVIAAVNDIDLIERIRYDVNKRNLLINVVDKPAFCDFYLSPVVNDKDLKIIIPTNGKKPTIRTHLKVTPEEVLTEELAQVNNSELLLDKLNGIIDNKEKELNLKTNILDEKEEFSNENRWRKIATYSLLAFAFMLIGHFIFSYLPIRQIADGTIEWYKTLGDNFPWMILAGFLAQLVDGATSMGYGVTSAIILMSANVSPAAISGSIHTAEMFASGASGYSHYKFGNVNKKLFKALLIPGIIGAVLGAILLVKFGETHIKYIKPIMAFYTLFLGIKIFITAFKTLTVKKKFKAYSWLAGVGGFLDSFGGGGWGPIVTATLITKGRTPRFVVGSVSLTEFFVTLASAFTFFTLIGVQHWQVILGLIIGGVAAAPIAAKLQGKLPRKASFILLGTMVVVWSIRILVKAF